MKKLTLAQFKRDASSGHMALILLKRYGKDIQEKEVCPVIAVKTTSIQIRKSKGDSWLDIPYASLIEYDGVTLKVFNKGFRPLNEKELLVMKQWAQIENTPEFKERSRIDALSDGMGTYYQQKSFFAKSSCPYLFSDDYSLRYSANKQMVEDPKIRGDCILEYKIQII